MEGLNMSGVLSLDAKEAIKKLGDDDPSTFLELAESFDKETLQPQLELMKKAIGSNDYKSIREQSHAIKGVCAYLQANRCRMLCECIHKAVDDKKYNLIDKYYPIMIYEFTVLKKEIRRAICGMKKMPFVELNPDDRNLPVHPKYSYALTGLKK